MFKVGDRIVASHNIVLDGFSRKGVIINVNRDNPIYFEVLLDEWSYSLVMRDDEIELDKNYIVSQIIKEL